MSSESSRKGNGEGNLKNYLEKKDQAKTKKQKVTHLFSKTLFQISVVFYFIQIC